MQEFTTPQPHEFSIDGRKFYLPAITLKDFEIASGFSELDSTERIKPFRDFIAGKVRPIDSPWWFGRARGRRGALQLNIVQLMLLWEGWVGLPGEARSSSPSSSGTTGTSSPSTSEPSTPAPSGLSADLNSQS